MSTTPFIETIEPRVMLSAEVRGDGTFVVAGTRKDDVISIARDAAGIVATVNGQATRSPEGVAITALRIEGRGGDDVIVFDESGGAMALAARVYGGAGNDFILGGAGADKIYAGEGDDTVNGGGGQDSVYGEGGADFLRGGGSSDLLDGADGADTLRGDGGNDRLHGGANADKLRGSDGDDSCYGGGSRDIISGDAGNDRLEAGAGNDALDGGVGNDTLCGDGGNSYMLGREGDDVFYAGLGDDSMFGGDGEDDLWGEQGNDQLHGGADNDDFYPESFTSGGNDSAPQKIQDYDWQEDILRNDHLSYTNRLEGFFPPINGVLVPGNGTRDEPSTAGTSGWRNGDLDMNGFIDEDDYFYIDQVNP